MIRLWSWLLRICFFGESLPATVERVSCKGKFIHPQKSARRSIYYIIRLWSWFLRNCASHYRKRQLQGQIHFFPVFFCYRTKCQVFSLHYAIHCNTLQHTATRCNTLQHAVAHCIAIRPHTATHTATRCNTLSQHTAIHSTTFDIIV